MIKILPETKKLLYSILNCIDNQLGEEHITDEYARGDGSIALTDDTAQMTVVNILKAGGNTNVYSNYLDCVNNGMNGRLIALDNAELITF